MEVSAGSSQVTSEFDEDNIENFVEDDSNLLWPPVSDEEKQELGGGLCYFRKLLIEHKFIVESESPKISERCKLIGRELFKRFLYMYGCMVFTEEEVLFSNPSAEESACPGTSSEETVAKKKRKVVQDIASSESNDEDDEDVRTIIPYAVKVKAVALADLHPKWSLSTLQKQSTRLLTSKSMLSKWRAQIEQGGTRNDKLEVINSSVYDRFTEARDQKAGLVTTRMLQQWAMAAAFQFLDENFDFKASNGWVTRFKSKYRISQRHVTKYVSQKDKRTMDELMETAAKYQQQTSKMVEQFDPDYVINTDQTRCEYRISSERTLSHKGEKVTEITVGQMNKLTHSYTAQYTITLSGKLLPKVFVCLQEVTGKFGPRVQKEVDEYMLRYPNVCITSTKSGKLQRNIYEEFLDRVIQPYVQTNPFLYISDSWGGQTSTDLHQMKFNDEDGLPTCTLSVIPPRCTPFCQPCDVYFYRQVKNYIRHFQNATYLLERNKEITSREDMIKIHSLVHDQLQAPAYKNMIRYAWRAAKLDPTEKEFFNNVNAVAFPAELRKKKCDCDENELAFIQCSWCRDFKCFDCFYNDYHPRECTREP